MISICSLIYRSTQYADAVWESAHEFTPALQDGSARFFFVANDASDKVLAHLGRKGYPHVVQNNARLTDDQLADNGFDPPEYIRRVYQGWNRAIAESEEQFVLVNSDCLFSPGWFEALISRLSPYRVVCSKLVERNHPKHGLFEGAIEGDFGDHPSRFDKRGFLNLCDTQRVNATEPGGAFMPCAMHRAAAVNAGLYPEGNPRGTYGDADFFERLKAVCVTHITALDSLVYHFKEGEMSE